MPEPCRSRPILLPSREGCERIERKRAWEAPVTGRAGTTPPCPPFARGGKMVTRLRNGEKTAQRNREESAACARPTFQQPTAGLALRPLKSLPPNGMTDPSRHRLISLKVTLPSTICDGPVMMQSESGLVSNHQIMIPAIQ